MKTTLTTIILALIFINVNAQAPNWAWAKGSSGSVGMNYSTCTATDALGNVYVAGEFVSPTITFGAFTLTNTDPTGWRDIFIVKYDAAGNVIWAKNEGSNSGDYVTSIAIDPFNNLFITGKYTASSITFGTITLSNSNFFVDPIFIVKYDNLGNVIWAKDIDGSWTDESHKIECDLNGNVYITGQFYSDSIAFESTTVYNNIDSITWSNIFIAKYNPSGNLIWAKSEGGSYLDYGYGISSDSYGNVYITGYFFSTSINIGGNTLVNSDSTGNSPDIFIAKYDAIGNLIWAKQEGVIGYDIAWEIRVDVSNNVYVTGEFSAPISFGATTLINVDARDMFIAKYDSSGNALWAMGAGGIGYDQGNSLSTDTLGNIYLSGIFASDSITFGATTLLNEGTNYDIYIVKLGSEGNVLWAKGAGSPGIDVGVSAIDDFGNIYVAGWFRYSTSLTFGATTLLNSDTSGNAQTMFIAKLGDISQGIKEQRNNNELNIYPNPNNGTCTIKSVELKLQSCNIYNVIGDCVFSQNVNNTNQINIDLSAQPKGIYFVETTDENWNVSNTKIIIQ